MASSRWHATFSRIAFDAILLPLLLVACLFFLLRGFRARHRSPAADYLLAGLFLGLGLLSYQAFRLVPLLVLAAFVLVPPSFRLAGRRGVAEAAAGLAIVALAAAVAAMPLLRYAADNSKQFWERTRTASLLRGRTPWEARGDVAANLADHVLMFNVRGDPNGRHNLPGEPMLHPLAGALFVLGIAGCIGGLRRYPARLLLAWLVAMLAAGVLSVRFESPQALRTIGVVPAVCLIGAVPLASFWQAWRDSFGARRWRILAIPAALAAGWLLIGSYDTFFRRQAGDFAVWNAFSTAETRMAREVRRLGSGWQYHIDPLLARHPTTRFLAPEFVEPEPYVAPELLPITDAGAEGAVVFVSERDGDSRRLIEQWYPGVTVIRHANPTDGHVALYEYCCRPAWSPRRRAWR